MADDERFGHFARSALSFLQDLDTGRVSGGSIAEELTRNARFILCGTSDPDSLYAWRTYAQYGIGCAIGIDKEVGLGVVDPGVVEGTNHRVRHWRPVEYEHDEVREVARRALSRLAERWIRARGPESEENPAARAYGELIVGLPQARSRVRAIAKDPSFRDEKELRVTVESITYGGLVTTPSNMGPRPHVKVVSTGEGTWGRAYSSATAAPKLPIRAIRLGPDAPESAVPATRWLLLANGYSLDPNYEDVDSGTPPLTYANTVLLDKSAHPYRTR